MTNYSLRAETEDDTITISSTKIYIVICVTSLEAKSILVNEGWTDSKYMYEPPGN